MLGSDPLKIYYFVVLLSDDPQDVTPFQCFSKSWRHLHWALRLLATLPADILEKNHKIEDVIAQRMGDLRPLHWLPVNVTTLAQLKTEDIGPFIVCFSGEEDSARGVSTWIADQSHPVLHVSSIDAPGVCHFSDFNHGILHRYCREAFEARVASFTPDRLEAGRACLANWIDPLTVPSGIEEMQHNILVPNHMSLLRASRSLEEGKPFVGKSEAEYTKVILESMKAIFRVRGETGFRPFHAMTLLNPAIILAEPAFMRRAYKRMEANGSFDEKVAAKTLRFMQTQRGLHNEIDEIRIKDLQQSRLAQRIVMERQSELATLTLGVGLKAAQTCSAVMRLSPGVNHVFPNLSAYAKNIRSHRIEARLKTPRLFHGIQMGLRQAVGDQRIAFLEQQGGPFKILSDAPMEWLPIGNLPLCLRYDCSRINVTPGNLFMAQLTNATALTFQPKDLHKILVVSSFTDNDPLRHVLKGALGAISNQWDKKVDLVFTSAENQEKFIRALNAFDGNIMIFDGHGADNADEPVGKILLGKDAVDVWQMRGFVRVPPIVILSACDTHGIDASSHATVGNGFLALGAYTVLATLLPVGGVSAAFFIARLIIRISEFLPAALAAKKRVLNWTEVIAGMLRMLYASEVLDGLVGPPASIESARGTIQTAANIDINADNNDWYDNLLDRIAQHRGDSREHIDSKARALLSRCQAIRYIQLGNPEAILIDNGTIRSQIMNMYSGEKLS